MNFDEKINENNEPPRAEDLLQLKVEIDMLGSGRLVHEALTYYHLLQRTMKEAEKNGWSDTFIKFYREYEAKARSQIHEIKTNRAKSEGLL